MTIKDIAKLADVSVSTVSRVLNDRPDVSEDSRRRVRAVIEAHRYVPNNSARDILGKGDNVTLTDEQLCEIIRDNPAGQDDQCTPFILIRKKQ